MIYKFWEINDEKIKELKDITGIGINYNKDEVLLEGFYKGDTVFSSVCEVRPLDEKSYTIKGEEGEEIDAYKEDFIETFISEVGHMESIAFSENLYQKPGKFFIAADNENPEDGNRVFMNMEPGSVTIKAIIDDTEKLLEVFKSEEEIQDFYWALKDACEFALERDEE
jgi:hypothetical protein